MQQIGAHRSLGFGHSFEARALVIGILGQQTLDEGEGFGVLAQTRIRHRREIERNRAASVAGFLAIGRGQKSLGGERGLEVTRRVGITGRKRRQFPDRVEVVVELRLDRPKQRFGAREKRGGRRRNARLRPRRIGNRGAGAHREEKQQNETRKHGKLRNGGFSCAFS